jgi:hypothetical protein
MKLNKYFPFVFLYFFVNSVALPLGLTYTAILGPFFYVWVLLKRKEDVLLPFLTVLSPFIIIQVLISGVDLRSYSVSCLNILMIYFFCQAVYTFLTTTADQEGIFKKLLFINCGLCLIAIVFYFTPYYNIFWIRQNVSLGIDQLLRLKLFTYEASYYALLFVPVFVFYLLQYVLGQNKINNYLLLFMLFLPLVLSFSMGVIGSLLISGVITFILYFRQLAKKRRVLNSFISLVVAGGVLLFILLFFFRDNIFFQRLANIFSGQDTSGEGRTKDAFLLAIKIVKEKNEYWGIGPGQLKIIGEDIIRGYYLYYDRTPVAIPNAAAETLLLFGWVGLSLRLCIQLFLFFYTKAWSNYYRLLLFLFMFIYQFTGSFITNPAEYVIWILAFTNVFNQYNIRPGHAKTNGITAGESPGSYDKNLLPGIHH